MAEGAITFDSGEIATYYAASVPKLSQRGRQWRGVCPIHQGKRFSFSVNPETGCWNCFSDCGRGGSLIDFEMTITGVDFKAALAAVCVIVGRPLPERAGITRDDWRRAQQARERERQDFVEAAYFADAATHIAESVLEELDTCDEERSVHTRLIEDLRKDARAVYREYRERDPKTAAALVDTGYAGARRLQVALARYLMAGVSNAA